MKNTFALCLLIVMAGVPLVAQPATGMSAMQYYVGNWTCSGGDVKDPVSNVALTYTLDSGVLREWVAVPKQGKMKSAYSISIAYSYDSKNGRYIQSAADSEGGWWVAFGKPLAGNTEQWMDHANSTGKLGRSEAVRTNDSSFSLTGYETASAPKPNFKATCKRS